MTLAEFLSRLDGVKERKPGMYQAFCPSHENKNTPSLNIYEKQFGEMKQVLVYCMVGCTTDDVCRSLGLTRYDLRDKAPSPEQIVSERLRQARQQADFFLSICDAGNRNKGKPPIQEPERSELRDKLVGEVLRRGEVPPHVTRK